MSLGSAFYGSSAYGGSSGSLSVAQAQAQGPYTLEVTFSSDIAVNAATLDPTNYSIPGLIVLGVSLDPQPNRVRLSVTLLSFISYELTVSPFVQGVFGEPLSETGNTASFYGWPTDVAAFGLRAVSPFAVQVLFAEPMLLAPEITDPVNFELTDLDGVSIPVLSVVPNNNARILRVRLNLGSPLTPGKPYAIRITDLVLTATGRALRPSRANVTWHASKALVSIPLSRFTGEVRARSAPWTLPEALTLQESLGVSVEPNRTTTITVAEGFTGILGTDLSQLGAFHLGSFQLAGLVVNVPVAVSVVAHEAITLRESLNIYPEATPGLGESTRALFGAPNGQVFFSPSLLPGALGQSTIKVDDVQVCTRAYDVYKPPVEIDPIPLYTHGGGLVPTPETNLSAGFVLFARFERLTGSKTNLTHKPEDLSSRPVDLDASVLLTQIYDPARFSLLSNQAWHLFDNVGLPFVVADNLSPVGPPVIGPGTFFANPAEDHRVLVGLSLASSLSVALAESLTLTEEHHRFPGSNQVLITVSESVTLGEGVVPAP